MTSFLNLRAVVRLRLSSEYKRTAFLQQLRDAAFVLFHHYLLSPARDMLQATVLILRLSTALLMGASLSEVYATPLNSLPLKEVHVIIDEANVTNGTSGIELDIDLDDMPPSITDAILRGDYSKLIQLEKSIVAMNESSVTDDTLDSQDYGRWDRTIFPPDDRRPVSNHDLYRYPYCAIGFLKSGCTAAFIGPRHALTAAHCVVGRSANERNMCRRQSCSSGGQLMHYAHRAYIPVGYTRDRNVNYDYALLAPLSGDVTLLPPVWIPKFLGKLWVQSDWVSRR